MATALSRPRCGAVLTVCRSFADADATLAAGDRHVRIALSGRAHMALADVRLEPSMLALQCGDTRVSLGPRVMQLLVALAESRGSVLSRDTLLGQCWGGAVVGDDALHRAVAGARRVLRSSRQQCQGLRQPWRLHRRFRLARRPQLLRPPRLHQVHQPYCPLWAHPPLRPSLRHCGDAGCSLSL